MEQEAERIRQILLGRRDLFEPIVLEYQNLVYTVCLNIVGNPSDAENMAQETFLAAYRSLDGYRGGGLKSWLCRIAVNQSVDHVRRRARYAFEELQEGMAASGESVEEAAERKERREKLETILSGLPDKYLAVVKAFYYRQMPVKEIARRLELPERTVETRLYRAKKILRERWEAHGT